MTSDGVTRASRVAEILPDFNLNLPAARDAILQSFRDATRRIHGPASPASFVGCKHCASKPR